MELSVRTVIPAVGLLLAACASASSMPAAVGDTTVLIGGANDDGTGFVDWHGQTATPNLIMGPQGGQHVWVMLRTGHAFNAEKMRILMDMTDLDTGLVVKPGQMPFTRTLTDAGDALVTDGNAITAYVKEPCVIKGHHIQVHVGVTDLVGLTGADQAVIIPSWSGFCSP